MVNRRRACRSSRAVISFSVSVPVLSVHICDVLPRVSTEASRLTIAPRFASRAVPIARVNDTTAGSPSGIAATATETGRIADMLRTAEPESSPLQRQIDALSRTLAVIAGVVIVLVMLLG